MQKMPCLALATLVALPWAMAVQASDLHIKIIASTCLNCHGPGGHSLGAVPSLAGQDREHLRTAMLEQKSGARETTVMRKYMNGYKDEEIAQLAEYFSKLK